MYFQITELDKKSFSGRVLLHFFRWLCSTNYCFRRFIMSPIIHVQSSNKRNELYIIYRMYVNVTFVTFVRKNHGMHFQIICHAVSFFGKFMQKKRAENS